MRVSHKKSIMFLFSAMLKEQYEDLTKGIIPCVTVFDVKNGIIEFLSHEKFKVTKIKRERLKTPPCPKCGGETYRLWGSEFDYVECEQCKYLENLNEMTIEDIYGGLWQAEKLEE